MAHVNLFAYWQSHAREFCRYIAAGTLTVVREKQKRNLPAAEQSDELHGARNKLGATINHAVHVDQKASSHASLRRQEGAPDWLRLLIGELTSRKSIHRTYTADSQHATTATAEFDSIDTSANNSASTLVPR
jgi:hypothetical protein